MYSWHEKYIGKISIERENRKAKVVFIFLRVHKSCTRVTNYRTLHRKNSAILVKGNLVKNERGGQIFRCERNKGIVFDRQIPSLVPKCLHERGTPNRVHPNTKLVRVNERAREREGWSRVLVGGKEPRRKGGIFLLKRAVREGIRGKGEGRETSWRSATRLY